MTRNRSYNEEWGLQPGVKVIMRNGVYDEEWGSLYRIELIIFGHIHCENQGLSALLRRSLQIQ